MYGVQTIADKKYGCLQNDVVKLAHELNEVKDAE